MATVWHVFQGCGFASWGCMLASVVALMLTTPAIVLSLARARAGRILGWGMLVLSFLPIGIGVLGMLSGRAKVDAAVAFVGLTPLEREQIRAEGYQEARGCMLVGGSLTLIPLTLSAVALVLSYLLPARVAAKSEGQRPAE